MHNLLYLIKKSFNRTQREKGQGLVEYALILGFAALVVLAIIGVMEVSVEDLFSEIAGNAPVAPPSLLSYTPPPTYTPIPTLDPNATDPPTATPTDPANPPTATNTSEPTLTHTPTPTATPACTGYSEYVIPGRVQMENFICGRSSVAFADSTGDGGPGSGSYRTDVSTEGPDLAAGNGGHYMGWFTSGEWVKYDVIVASSQLYDFTFQVASDNSNGNFHLELINNGQVIHTTSSISVPNTGGSQSWTNITISGVPFVLGSNQINVVTENGGFNLDYFEATQAAIQPTATNTAIPTATDTPIPTATNTPTATPSSQIVTLIDADFENGQDGFGYSDNAFYNTNQRNYAHGYRDIADDNSYLDTFGALVVSLGNRNNQTIGHVTNTQLGMTGGWFETFSMPSAGSVTVTFRYRLVMAPQYESNECGEVLVSVNYVRYGDSGNQYVTRSCGGVDTNWQTFSFQTESLSSGDNRIIIGGYNNRKTASNEVSYIIIDDVFVETN